MQVMVIDISKMVVVVILAIAIIEVIMVDFTEDLYVM